jgi:hypothetical protein
MPPSRGIHTLHMGGCSQVTITGSTFACLQGASVVFLPSGRADLFAAADGFGILAVPG